MNILTDLLPVSVNIGGEEVLINTDFRAGIEFELLVERGETQIGKLLYPFFPDGIQARIEDADEFLEAVLCFYRCGEKPEKKSGSTKAPGNDKQAYSFDVDGATIYADFWRYYGLDLSKMYLHWWAFRALLMGLPDDSGYKQRVYYRTCDLSKLPKKERERVNKIRNLIAINKDGQKLTLEERNAQMINYAVQRSKNANKEVSA